MKTKTEFRRYQLEKLRQRVTETRQAESELVQRLFASAEWQQAQTVGVTLAATIEVPTAGIIAQAKREGKAVFYPRTRPQRKMVFLPASNEAKLELSRFGVLEPPYDPAKVQRKIDLLLVPGIAFALDSKRRLGFGGGYYDRYLKNFSGKTVALAAPAMVYPTASWQVDEFDMPVQRIITLTEQQNCLGSTKKGLTN